MNDLNSTILQKASGETRLNPDEQRLYMGTYRERVVLIVSFDDLSSEVVGNKFDTICQKLANSYSPLFLKLSPALSDKQQISLLKIAQTFGITTAIIDEKIGQSPYALVFHTNHAVDNEEVSLESIFPNIISKPEKKRKMQNLPSGKNYLVRLIYR
ncbi:DUF1694 domain-containing protein [Streptococcus suis]|uniref:DUF1694 domain-containing protein n=1 Tax=Streptococcus suis TaxID=1307 RepID=UPI000B04A664|nr:DUF1694 domain-containing protein [Streptococcus suis]WNF74309.1 DUF1694 domain-containing protein [Streptococcus suis]